MLLALILGVGAGFAAPFAEPRVKDLLETAKLGGEPISEKEISMSSLALCTFVAAVLAWLADDDYLVALTLGVALGVFGPRLIDRFKKRDAPDYDN